MTKTREEITKNLYKKSWEELEKLCNEYELSSYYSKREIILELVEKIFLQQKEKKIKEKKKEKQEIEIKQIAPLYTVEKFWIIRQDGEMIIDLLKRYIQPHIKCKRRAFIPRYNQLSYQHYFGFKENQGKIRKTTKKKRRNGKKEEMKMINHTWIAKKQSIYSDGLDKEKNGFPRLNLTNTNYWIREMEIDQKKYLTFLKKLKIQYNEVDQELSIYYEYNTFIWENNFWIKIQGVDNE